MKNHLLSFLAIMMFIVSPFIAFGQVTTSTIAGTVMSGQQALPEATVLAVHTPTGQEYGTTTRADGRYTLPNLRIGGPYTVKVSFVGYQSSEVSEIYLKLGEKYTQNFDLKESSVSVDGLEIVAQASDVMNSDRTGAATMINSKQIQNLPTITRNTSDYYRLNPAADGNSFAGRNDQYNNFSLDGSIFNNPFGLDAATPGGQTDAAPISLDAIEQIEVSVAPYDVSQAGFTGASINAVTKSGTNEFKGTAFGLFRNDGMTSNKVAGTEFETPDLSQVQYGASIGGPIIKDKLFFFANFEVDQRTDLGANVVADRGSNTGGANVSRVAADSLELVSQALFNRFGYVTGDYEGYKHNSNSSKGILKLDFNINKSNTLTLTYNFLNAFKEKPAHPSAIGRRGPDLTTLQFANSGYRINNIIHSVGAELNTIIGNKYANKLQVGRTAFRDSRDPMSTPFPVININQDGIRAIVAGHEPFSINNVLDQDVYQISDKFSIYAGAHTITVGASLEAFLFNNSFNLGAYDGGITDGMGGTFSGGYPSVSTFLDSLNAGTIDAAVTGAQNTFSNNNTNDTWALAETNLGQLAVYFQDEWVVNEALTLSAGVRIDVPLYFNTSEKITENLARNCCYFNFIEYFDPATGDTIFFDQTVLPQQTPLISPRLGFNYDVKGDQTMQLRGGTGLFTGRLPFVWIGNQVANPNFFFYSMTSPDFKYPQVWRTNLGYDHKLAGGMILSADFIYTKDINGMMVRNYGLKTPTGVLAGVDDRPIYTAADRNSFANNAYVFTNTNVGSSFNMTLQAQKTWENNLFVSIAYNFLDAKDASSIEAEISGDAYDRNPAFGNVNTAVIAPSLYGNRHRIVGSAYKRFEYASMATTIGVFIEYAQGGRFSYTYSGDINNDGSGLNDLIYIPTDAEIDAMSFGGNDPAAQRAALKAFLTQDGYAADRRGQYAEKYGILSPWYSNMDLRVAQDLILGNENIVQLTLNMQNVGNFINSNWGVRQLPVNTQPIGVSVAGGVPTYSFDTSLTETFAYDFSLLSRWQLQIGARYIF
jgi:hypothetical protein